MLRVTLRVIDSGGAGAGHFLLTSRTHIRTVASSGNSNHGFDFQAWAAHGVPFLSRSQEASIKEKMEARWARIEAEAAEAEAKAEAQAMEVEENSSTAKPAVLTARDGTTFESLKEADRNMILEARKKVRWCAADETFVTGFPFTEVRNLRPSMTLEILVLIFPPLTHSTPKVELLLAEGTGDSEYVERSVELDPMTSRMRWLMYEFVGANNSAVKLSNLSGPPSAQGIEVLEG